MSLCEIRTVGELRELLRLCEDDESLTICLEGRFRKQTLRIDGAGSTAGGRATILWLRKVK